MERICRREFEGWRVRIEFHGCRSNWIRTLKITEEKTISEAQMHAYV